MIGEKKSRGILLSMRPAELQAERVECADHQFLRNCFPTTLPIRSLISVAAAVVKVMARMLVGPIPFNQTTNLMPAPKKTKFLSSYK